VKRALVRLGRRYASEGPGEIPKGLLRYGHEMKLWPLQDAVPLLVDHDEGKQIGRVDELITFDDVDGQWLTARCELYPDAAKWIKKGSPASFKSTCLRESTFIDGYIYGGYVQEVSILRAEKPAEPGARVILLYEPDPPGTPRQKKRAQSATPVTLPRNGLIRRNTGRVLGVR
jgi:hypothetical protein